ncbi:helix-turn-helix domain-containing protein [Croceicoccus bisphenolivorans]|uniref:helix-turn-helix domain-containing protein n=1 Tax=Croceicoccus bisphenolivorans TaxID=1783232 RepID=UPI000AEB5AFD|nr:RodZ domain-containing protein [Croceicoccus bisphenolivorans]
MDDSEDGTGTPPANDVDAAATLDAGAGGVGARLRAERERQGLSRAEVGERTKIAERHLDTIEEGRFSDLPGRTYAVGFARSYARALGIDETEIVEAVREEMGVAGPQAPVRNLDYLEPGDPARVPSSALAWGVGGLLVVVLLVGFFVWRGFFMPASELPPLEAERKVAATPPAAATAAPAEETVPEGAVTFTATVDGIWVKFYDRNNRQLFQKQMALDESFTIPEDADGPQVWTGRPDALKITIGGREVAPLATEQRTIRNVPVDAASLNARASGASVP